MSDLGLILVGLAIATGLVGVVVPVLPGSLLAWAAIVVWARAVGGRRKSNGCRTATARRGRAGL